LTRAGGVSGTAEAFASEPGADGPLRPDDAVSVLQARNLSIVVARALGIMPVYYGHVVEQVM
jgi:hypothetical protein